MDYWVIFHKPAVKSYFRSTKQPAALYTSGHTCRPGLLINYLGCQQQAPQSCLGPFWGETPRRRCSIMSTLICMLHNWISNKSEDRKRSNGWKWGFSFVFQVVVTPYEAATNVLIELDLDNSLFGFPRELVVAGAGKNGQTCLVNAVLVILTDCFVCFF